MNPICHPSNTRVLNPPAGWSEDLPVEPLGITDQIVEGVPCIWSFWMPDPEELASLNAGGPVILSIVGRNMPPAAVLVAQPQDDAPSGGKYNQVLQPFLRLMEAELQANSGKGDRPGWLSMTRDEALLEIYYHVSKLQKATRDNDLARIREHAADVANMAMMLLDVCGGILASEEV